MFRPRYTRDIDNSSKKIRLDSPRIFSTRSDPDFICGAKIYK